MLLGLKLRFESIETAQLNIYRVISIFNPQLEQEIVKEKDFLIATKEFIITNLEELKSKLNIYKQCTLIVYNIDQDCLKEIQIKQSPGGSLGLELSSGYLHDLSFIYRS